MTQQRRSVTLVSWPAFILFCIFLVLKLTHYIHWSWWFITMPLYAGVALIIAFVVGAVLFATVIVALAGILDSIDRHKRRKRLAKRQGNFRK